MIYRSFGRTGFDVSVLSAGFMRAMHSWQVVPDNEITPACQQNFADIVRTALDHGINHFETAHAYGTSEQQLGSALRDIPRNTFLLQTKVQPASDPKKFIKEVAISLDRLGVERVDLLAIHGINDYRSLWQVCREGGCLAAARKLQKEGKVGAVGFSGHGPVDVILAAIKHDGDNGFDYLNLHWYYIYQVNSEALEAAAGKGLGVFIISPTDKGGMLQEPAAVFRDLCSPLEPMVFNDVYCLQRSEISTISVGASRPSDFIDHISAIDYLESGGHVTEIDVQCRAAMKKATGYSRPEALWDRLPAWNTTPGLINIPLILWLYNLARGWGLVAYSRQRYQKLRIETKWVPGNNGSGVGRLDLQSIAEKAGMKSDELVYQLKKAHTLLGGDETKGEKRDHNICGR
jgi:predicted aldo/keto reductase-like oxidoreductase